MRRILTSNLKFGIALSCAAILAGCEGGEGPAGPQGTPGTQGPEGTPGNDGVSLPQPGVAADAPLSSVIAASFAGSDENFADTVKGLVDQVLNDTLPEDIEFPLANRANDKVRTVSGAQSNIVISWLEPLSFDPEGPRFGANNDFIAYFGDGDITGLSPIFDGDDREGHLWVSHEYVSNSPPTATSAPSGQHFTLSQFAYTNGMIDNDYYSDTWDDDSLSAYTRLSKQQLGGSWIRIFQDPATDNWEVDRSFQGIRYDATSDTQFLLTGISTYEVDTDDEGNPLPAGVISGTAGNCSGTQTPWGTVVVGEENVQFYYGDLEPAWNGDQKFITGAGFDPGARISPDFSPSETSDFGQDPNVNARHNRDLYGYLAEIDPGVAPDEYRDKTTAGVGHAKFGAVGRARWENATFVTDTDWELIPGQPIVLYTGGDRRGGHIYKFVSSEEYTSGMSKAAIRELLDDGTLYVAHFENLDHATGVTLVGGAAPTEAARGNGRWIELSLTSSDIAPNAAALGDATKTVGQALQDVNWNNIGGFETQDDILWALYTAANKIGVSELNRPEDVEWNPKDLSGTPRIYVAFTNHTRQVALNQDGVLYDPDDHETDSPKREDNVGSLFAMQEADPAEPGNSSTFTYFQVFRGTEGQGAFDAANPDNILIDDDGGVWFGTDGNFSTNKTADAFYYLDLDPAHQAGDNATFGKAFRVIAAPSDAEVTGPAFSSEMGSLFVSIQHPGERFYSTFPQGR